MVDFKRVDRNIYHAIDWIHSLIIQVLKLLFDIWIFEYMMSISHRFELQFHNVVSQYIHDLFIDDQKNAFESLFA